MLLTAIRPAFAQQPVSPAYQARAEQLVTQLGTPGDEGDFFSDVFLTAVPAAQWRALTASLREKHGAPQGLGHVSQQSDSVGTVEVRYAKATVGFQLVIAPQPPGKVIGLRLTGEKVAGDSFERLAQEIEALPGIAGLSIARLGDGPPQPMLSIEPAKPMATGSSFKLYVLAEAARAVEAGERRWSDVLPLAHKSFSGRLMRWPDGAPMTLHSLATAMIAESDNSAADTLLLALGRHRVDAMVAASGHRRPADTLPLLTTAEAFALKMPGNAALRARYSAAAPDARRALLREQAGKLGVATIDVGAVAETPTAIDTIEWFAQPRDMIALLDWLRRRGGDALPITAVNPGIAPGDAQRWRYLGYKGGSEPGVIAMNFLGQAQDGRWYAVAGSWNDTKARIDEGRFLALMTRAMNLVAEGAGK